MHTSAAHDRPSPSPRLSGGLRGRIAGAAVVLLAAALALAPELAHGPSCGHDFDFHLVSWLDCLNSWQHGILYPHWAPSANYGAGEPRFVFYSPLTWMLGAALGAILPWPWVPLALTFLLLAGTGIATRALAREWLSEGAATLAGGMALFSGYALFTAYERTAFAELAGGFWIPLVLLFALRRRGPESRRAPLRQAFDGSAAPLALAVAGAWLSNPTVGLMACYLLAAVALGSALAARSRAPLLRATAGAALGMTLIAFYLLPATWEQRWVDIHQVTEDPGQTLENNWLFAVHSDPSLALHDLVLHTASLIAVLMVAAAFAGLVLCALRRRLPGERQIWIPLALIPAAVLFLQLPLSRPLWNLLPDLRFLQFPWRWLVVLEAPMAVFLAAGLWPDEFARRRWRVAVAAACIAAFLAMTHLAGQTFFQSCDDEDSVAGMLAVDRSGQGFPGTNEYEPLGAKNALVATGLPPSCLAATPDVALGALPSSSNPDQEDNDLAPAWSAAQGTCLQTSPWRIDRPEHKRLTAVLARGGFLILRLRSYPAWRIRVNGHPAASLPQRRDGLIAVPVPQGLLDLTVDWTTTPDAAAGRALGLLAVLPLTALWLFERKQRRARLS